jgi:hypothetical protein
MESSAIFAWFAIVNSSMVSRTMKNTTGLGAPCAGKACMSICVSLKLPGFVVQLIRNAADMPKCSPAEKMACFFKQGQNQEM